MSKALPPKFKFFPQAKKEMVKEQQSDSTSCKTFRMEAQHLQNIHNRKGGRYEGEHIMIWFLSNCVLTCTYNLNGMDSNEDFVSNEESITREDFALSDTEKPRVQSLMHCTRQTIRLHLQQVSRPQGNLIHSIGQLPLPKSDLAQKLRSFLLLDLL